MTVNYYAFSKAFHWRITTALSFLLLLFSSPWGYSATPKNILLLNSWSKDLPWQVSVEKGLIGELDLNSANSTVYTEYLDAERFPNKNHNTSLNQYLKEKYKETSIDLVIAESLPASIFLSQSPALLPAAKRIYLPDSNKPLKAQLSNEELVIPVFEDYFNAFKEMLRLAKPKHVYIVADNYSASGKNQLTRFNEATKELRSQVAHTYLRNESLAEILNKISKLPDDSAVFYLLVFQDGSGTDYVPYRVAQKIASTANAPVFSMWEVLMGSGILGGYLISGERVGQVAARSALEFFKGSAQTTSPQDTFGYYYDATVLDRWDIEESNLPEEAQILFTPPDFFEVYKLEIITSSITFIFLFFISILLFVANQRRKIYIHELEIERWLLESRVAERTKDLEAAIHKAELDARTDVLTQLANRRAFFEQAKTLHNQAKRYDRSYSIIILDIDFFKDINDVYGHAVGDSALIALGKNIKQCVRDSDIAARIGGEEFAILISESSPETVFKLAQRLLKSAASIRVPINDDELSFTISMGIATLLPEHQSLEQVLSLADEAMYAAKNNGRNQIVVSTPTDLPDYLG